MYKVDKSTQDHPAWGFALNTDLCRIPQLRNVNQHLSYLWWLINRKLSSVHDTGAFSYLRSFYERKRVRKKKRKKKRNLSKQNKELSRTFKAAAFYFMCQNKYCQISKAYWTNYKRNANLSTETQWQSSQGACNGIVHRFK